MQVLTISRLLKVDVGIAEGATGDDVAAHPDGHDGSCWGKLLI